MLCDVNVLMFVVCCFVVVGVCCLLCVLQWVVRCDACVVSCLLVAGYRLMCVAVLGLWFLVCCAWFHGC